MTPILITVLAVSAISDLILVVWLLRNALLYPRQVDLDRFHPTTLLSVDAFRTRLAGEAWINDEPMKRCLAAMRWTMNRVQRIEANNSRHPEDLLAPVEAGHGAICGNMATLLSCVLSAVNIENRVVMLARNIFDTGDVHALVEARLEDRWICFDPTFNLTYHSADGTPLSAQACKLSLYEKGASGIVTRFHGEVAYPARLETYYANIFFFFNNVLVLERDPLWLGLLPLRHRILKEQLKQSRRVYYQNVNREDGAHLRFLQRFYIVALYLAGRSVFWCLLIVLSLLQVV